jgi:hypothetical protein
MGLRRRAEYRHRTPRLPVSELKAAAVAAVRLPGAAAEVRNAFRR